MKNVTFFFFFSPSAVISGCCAQAPGSRSPAHCHGDEALGLSAPTLPGGRGHTRGRIPPAPGKRRLGLNILVLPGFPKGSSLPFNGHLKEMCVGKALPCARAQNAVWGPDCSVASVR